MNIGVVFAGGVGSRVGFVGYPKQFILVNGKPVIIHTLEHFEECPDIDKVVVVCVINWIEYMAKLAAEYHLEKVAAIVPGGETGQESIYQGLLAAQKLTSEEDTVVLIHDGVRPLISSELLSENVKAVREYGSAITCAVLHETPTKCIGAEILETVPRSQAWVAKAPQSFWLNEILEAHEAARLQGKNDYTDSCTMMMQHKPSLHRVECGMDNIKITKFEDIYLMQALLRAREDKRNYSWGQL